MTLKFDLWPWKTMGHLFNATSSFVHHFLVIGEFNLELQSGKGQYGSNSKVLRAMLPWNLTDVLEKKIVHLFYATLNFALFLSDWWIQTGVTVRKNPIWVKCDNFLSCVTLKFDIWPWKTIGQLFHATSSSVHHFIIIWEFKLELQSGNG